VINSVIVWPFALVVWTWVVVDNGAGVDVPNDNIGDVVVVWGVVAVVNGVVVVGVVMAVGVVVGCDGVVVVGVGVETVGGTVVAGVVVGEGTDVTGVVVVTTLVPDAAWRGAKSTRWFSASND
jgi:hypothetical protein